MTKDYKDITNSISEYVTKFSETSGDFMQAFRGTSQNALKTNVLDEKTKEFLALAIGIAKQCDGCIGFHTKKLVKLGATREEFIEVLNVAVYMGGGPGLMYAADALRAYDQFST